MDTGGSGTGARGALAAQALGTGSTHRPDRARRAVRRLLAALAVAVLLVVAGVSIAATVVTRPHRTAVGPPRLRNFESVSFTTAAGDTLRGWLALGKTGHGAIALLHGIHSDRRSMTARALVLARAGYGVLLFDFHAEGESSGRRITFGATEAADAAAAVAYLRLRAPGERIGAIGVSMGGAAALLGNAPLDVDALVLESVYPTIDAAVRDRLAAYAGPLGTIVTPLFLAQLRPRFGIDPAALRPIDHIAQVRAPLLLMSGTADHDTHIAEAKALFARAHAPKTFWAVPGAGHEDLHAYDPSDYEQRVLAFFAATLSR